MIYKLYTQYGFLVKQTKDIREVFALLATDKFIVVERE